MSAQVNLSTWHQHKTKKNVKERDCLVAKTIYLIITKLLRPGKIANGAQNPFESIKFAILSRSSFLGVDTQSVETPILKYGAE